MFFLIWELKRMWIVWIPGWSRCADHRVPTIGFHNVSRSRHHERVSKLNTSILSTILPSSLPPYIPFSQPICKATLNSCNSSSLKTYLARKSRSSLASPVLLHRLFLHPPSLGLRSSDAFDCIFLDSSVACQTSPIHKILLGPISRCQSPGVFSVLCDQAKSLRSSRKFN